MNERRISIIMNIYTQNLFIIIYQQLLSYLSNYLMTYFQFEKILLIILLISSCFSSRGVYTIHADFPEATYTCLKDQGFEELTFYLPSSTIGVTTNSTTYINIQRAHSSGLKISALYTPCRVLSPQQIVTDLMKKFGFGKIDRFWLAPFDRTLQKYCDWQDASSKPYYPPVYNCKFLTEITNLLLENNLRFGIVSNEQQWNSLFESCNSFRDSPLYWFLYPPNNDPTLNMWRSFGGWPSPRMKAYTGENVCGALWIYNNIFDL